MEIVPTARLGIVLGNGIALVIQRAEPRGEPEGVATIIYKLHRIRQETEETITVDAQALHEHLRQYYVARVREIADQLDSEAHDWNTPLRTVPRAL